MNRVHRDETRAGDAKPVESLRAGSFRTRRDSASARRASPAGASGSADRVAARRRRSSPSSHRRRCRARAAQAQTQASARASRRRARPGRPGGRRRRRPRRGSESRAPAAQTCAHAAAAVGARGGVGKEILSAQQVMPPFSISPAASSVPSCTNSGETKRPSRGQMCCSSQGLSGRSSAMPRSSVIAACVCALTSPGSSACVGSATRSRAE